VLAGVLALGGFYLPAQTHLGLATAAVALVGGALVLSWAIRAPSWGCAALLVTAVLAPVKVQSQIDICLLLAVTVCAGWVLRPALLRRPLELKLSPTVVSVLAFVSIAVLSFVVGQYPWFPTDAAPMRAQLGGLAVFLLSGGLFLAVGHQIRSVRRLERLTWLFIGAGGVFVVTDLVAALTGLSPLAGLIDPGSAGSMFWTWLAAMSFSQGLCNKDLGPSGRVFALAVGTLGLARGMLLAFSWASGWLPPMIALGVILLLQSPRTAFGVGVLAVVPIVLLGARIWNGVMDYESYSWTTRLEAWSLVLQMLEQNPLLGYGPANYYHYTLLFPILGWWVRFNSHNNYIDLLAQTGVVGLLAFFWFAYQIGRLMLRLWSRAPTGFPRAYAAGAVAGLVASLAAAFLADWIVPFAYNIGLTGFRSSLLFWFFLGGGLALHRLSPAREAAQVGVHTERPARVRLEPAAQHGL
jgi:hypothetical protein